MKWLLLTLLSVASITFDLRGGPEALYDSIDHEVILSGPADTGKTLAGCLKAHSICQGTPRVQGAIVRKTFNSLAGSVCKTFERITEGHGVTKFGGTIPTRYLYPNGSCIWLGGMDNPDSILSSERDFFFVPQAEQLTEGDWETLGTRCTGRGAVVAHAQIFGDCNPGGSRHWIRSRKSLRLITATHRDNPSLYDDQGAITEEGRKRIGILSASLTGVRRKRLLDGIWATAEGAVYDTFDAATHVTARPVSEFKRWFLAMDEGYTNPAVILLVGADSDDRWHVSREFYKRGVLQGDVVKTALSWFREMNCELAAVDAAAAGLVADLCFAGVRAVSAKGRVLDGIQGVQNRLAIAKDGRPRLTIDTACAELQNEFESYQWKPAKDAPEKEFDHALDALRYLDDAIGDRRPFAYKPVDRAPERLSREQRRVCA